MTLNLPVDRVRAVFGGENLVFRLPRERLTMFEHFTGKSVALLHQQLTGGFATISDILSVLEASAPHGWGNRGSMNIAGFGAAGLMRGLSAGPASKVEQVLRDNPPMRYLILAQGVLTAALFGLPEEVAKFDESEEPTDE